MRGRTHYETLELQPGASTQEVRAAYRRLVRRYHPDLNPGDEEALGRIKEINQAYEVLCDPASQARYDRDLMCAEQSAPGQADSAPRGYSGYYRYGFRDESRYEYYGIGRVYRPRRRYTGSPRPSDWIGSPFFDYAEQVSDSGYYAGIGDLFDTVERLMRAAESLDADIDYQVARLFRRMRRRF